MLATCARGLRGVAARPPPVPPPPAWGRPEKHACQRGRGWGGGVCKYPHTGGVGGLGRGSGLMVKAAVSAPPERERGAEAGPGASRGGGRVSPPGAAPPPPPESARTRSETCLGWPGRERGRRCGRSRAPAAGSVQLRSGFLPLPVSVSVSLSLSLSLPLSPCLALPLLLPVSSQSGE